MDDQCIAVVTFLPSKLKHAVAIVTEGCLEPGTSVTFSLDAPVWRENSIPNYGTRVVLGDLRFLEGGRGWRSFDARYYRPSDEKAKLASP